MKWLDNLLRVKYKYKSISFATGGGDYLPDSAKVHKRNLMYASLVCIIIATIGHNKSFESVFGFKLTEGGIQSSYIISILAVICIYELISLNLYIKDCKSSWFCRNLDNEKSDFKDNIEIGIFMYEDDIERIENKIDRTIKNAMARYRLYKKLLESANDCVIYRKSEAVVEEGHEAVIEHITSALEGLRDSEGFENNELLRTVDQRITNHHNIHRYRNETINDILSEYNAFQSLLDSRFDDIKGLLERIEKSTNNLSSQVVRLQAGDNRYMFMDFIFPSIFGILAITVSFISLLSTHFKG